MLGGRDTTLKKTHLVLGFCGAYSPSALWALLLLFLVLAITLQGNDYYYLHLTVIKSLSFLSES